VPCGQWNKLKEIPESWEILQRHHKNVVLTSSFTEPAASQSKPTGSPTGLLPREAPAAFSHEDDRVEMEQDDGAILLAAANDGDDKMVRLLLGLPNIDPVQAGEFGRTPLVMAVRNDHTKAVDLLLITGRVNVNYINPISATPIISIAAEQGVEEITQMLLSQGAGVEIPSGKEKKYLPLQYAAKGGHEAIVRLLLERGADINLKTGENGETALHDAAGSATRRLSVSYLIEEPVFMLARRTTLASRSRCLSRNRTLNLHGRVNVTFSTISSSAEVSTTRREVGSPKELSFSHSERAGRQKNAKDIERRSSLTAREITRRPRL